MNSSEKDIAVIAVSGGLDSCVTAAIAKQEFELAFAHFNYRQRTEKRELKAFNDLADFFNVDKKLIVDISHLSEIGGSSLTDKNIEVTKADLNNKRYLPAGRQVPTSYVPFRNANILAACVSWAEVLKAKAVFIGAVQEDSSGYPDCRADFFSAFEKMVQLGTKPSTCLEIKTPIINLTKKEIIKLGMELKAPFHLTWSCYKSEDKACGVCDSCALRLQGFKQAGFEDNILYDVKPDYAS
jgi:7-cyano-7-deazaguanine synthase